jgi:hypothetical protein
LTFLKDFCKHLLTKDMVIGRVHQLRMSASKAR